MRQSYYFLLSLLFMAMLTAGLFHARPPAPSGAGLTANGYGGPITMNMATDQGVITQLKVVHHHETTSYISRLDRFLGQFIGRNTGDELALGKDIDAISGATITSRAITEAVRQKLQGTSHQEKAHIPIRPVIISTVLLILAVIAFVTRHNALRWAVLFGGAAYFGVIAHTMLSIIQVAQAGIGHAPTLAGNPLWWMLILLGFGTTLIIGRIYCGNLCPFAIVQEILHQFMLRKKPDAVIITADIDRSARAVKYILLFVLISACLALHTAAPANIEPFVTFFAGHGTKLAWALLTLMLVMAVFNFRFWCKYLCPVGALTSLTAAFSLIRIRPTSACVPCGTCRDICPTRAITTDTNGTPVIDPGECIACARCLRLCPKNALTLGPCALPCSQPHAAAEKTGARDHNRPFIFILAVSVILTGLAAIQEMERASTPSLKTATEPATRKTDNTRSIREKFIKMGLPLHESKYGRPADE